MFTCSKVCLGWCEKYADLAPLVLRVLLGLILFVHGWQKLTEMGVDGTAGFLGSLGFPIPAVFAVILIAVEVLGGIALILGIFTHIAAKLALLVALFAFFVVHVKNGFFIQNGGYEFIILIFGAAFSLMMTGAGKYSLDAKMRQTSGASSMKQSQM